MSAHNLDPKKMATDDGLLLQYVEAEPLDCDLVVVAEVFGETDAETAARLALFKASPKMLAALMMAQNDMDRSDRPPFAVTSATGNAIDAAIAEAEGRAE